MNLAIRSPISFCEMQVLLPIQKIQKRFSYIKLPCFKFLMHPRLHLLLICLFSQCLSMICLFIINSLFTYSFIYCYVGSHTHVKYRCRELPVYTGNRFGGHVFLWIKLVLSLNSNKQANDFIVLFMETQLRQFSQICFLNWTNYVDLKHRIFFLHYLPIPSPCFSFTALLWRYE